MNSLTKNDWVDALWKTLLIVLTVATPVFLAGFIFSLFVGADGYLTAWGQIYVFCLIFGTGFSLVVHGLIHSVNQEYHKLCIWCLVGKFYCRFIEGEG